MTIVVPSVVSKEEIIGEFPPRVDRELRRSNAGLLPEAQLRIRMAVTHGDVVVEEDDLMGGPALVEAARIRDIAPLRRAMAAAPEAFLGLVLADHVYRTSVRDGDPALLPRAYRRVVAADKDYLEPAWIRLWGVELPGDTATVDAGTNPTGPTEPPSPTASTSPPGPDRATATPEEVERGADGRGAGDTYDISVGVVQGGFAVGRNATSHHYGARHDRR
ncbi:hypothetical protein [Micromonospora okii]|uniref:hypothetical protein n=1 Tax=Micromonospora okii TaxID=1182970 RepID=UPI001E4B0F71|nr:hypothetical protein [Micromonospora okii]